jgi:hypothetical protein
VGARHQNGHSVRRLSMHADRARPKPPDRHKAEGHTHPMRRALVGAIALLLPGVVLVVAGPVELHPWRCHHVGSYRSPREAADAYYASCWGGPEHLAGPTNGGKGGSSYASWFALDEFTASYGGGKVRWLLVGKRTATSGWRALPPEGTGP